ncbi:MAG: T9SS type A sorting domain-containing protein, partial [Bacteroidetes bacterium]|nr:T9SS type A sorting domain-containing protein [Bacteroidota bacterium]
ESVGNFKVMPNPFSNATSMSFDLKKDANVSIRLNDMVGKTYDVFKGDLKAGSHTYQVDAAKLQLAKGTYILSINTGSSNAAKTVIKID